MATPARGLVTSRKEMLMFNEHDVSIPENMLDYSGMGLGNSTDVQHRCKLAKPARTACAASPTQRESTPRQKA